MDPRLKHSGMTPIGVFDSGLGGLTVVRALVRRLPHENVVYVGDTARVPYGGKSPDTIRRYALQIAFFLLQKKVKLVVVACNTVSAVALQALRNFPVPIVGVIEPGARAAVLSTKTLKIGVIGTSATIGSHSYKKAIRTYSPRAMVSEQACPLLVPLVEEGWLMNSTTRNVAKGYLKPLLARNIDTLVLGCTHYPLLKPVLQSVSGKKVQLIDSAEETAKDVEELLRKTAHVNTSRRPGRTTFYVTDNPGAFSTLGQQFLGNHLPPGRRLIAQRLSLDNL